jgi:hypothetical protein
MSPEQLTREVLDHVDGDRRPFVERAVLDRSFAVPVVASFDLDSLTMGSAAALTPNGTAELPND